MADDIKWLIGALVAIVSLLGGVIARDRNLMQSINEGDKRVETKVDDIRRDYVRRDDLDKHLMAIESNIKLIREENKESARRLDSFLNMLRNKHDN